MKILFYGSDKYSKIVEEALKEDRRLLIVKDIQDKPDVGVLASYSRILPIDELKAIPHGILNLHPSLLPKYRGPSPVQTAILNGEKQSGITIIKMDEEIDHGPIVSQLEETILPEDTSESLYRRLFNIGSQKLVTILPDYLEDKIKLKSQDHSQATYSKKLSRDSGKIDWQKPPEYLERMVRAMFPWPGTWAEIRDTRYEISKPTKRLKILKAHLESGRLVLDLVQLEGKKPVTFKQFREGYPEAKIIY